MARESDLLLWDGSRGSGWILKVRMVKGLVDAYEGASIAINGVCLTVLEWPVADGVVSFGVAPETIKLTNLVRQRICASGSPRLALWLCRAGLAPPSASFLCVWRRTPTSLTSGVTARALPDRAI